MPKRHAESISIEQRAGEIVYHCQEAAVHLRAIQMLLPVEAAHMLPTLNKVPKFLRTLHNHYAKMCKPPAPEMP